MLMPEVKPYVRFFYEECEDRNASIETGMYTPRNVAMIEVTTVGGKTSFIDEADGWLRKINEKSLQGQYNRDWAKDFRAMYDIWKSGEEIPEDGIAIRMCLMFNPAEQRSILNANIRTLEDLAACNEEAIQAMGPGGRGLRDRARTAIEQSRDTGKIAREQEAMCVRLAELERQNEELREALSKAGQDEPERKRGPGRPRVNQDSVA